MSSSTILAWITDNPLVCSPFESTFEIAKKMAAKKNNCALVKERNKITGIFTAKDLAFKVVSRGLHPKLLKAKDIMTSNPISVLPEEPASSALNKMIKYKIRHLPVLDHSGTAVGMLDITKCFKQTLARLRKLQESAQKLNDALELVQANIATMDHNESNVDQHSEMYYQAQEMVRKAKADIHNLYESNVGLTGKSDDMQDFEALLQIMEAPTLAEVLASPDHPQPLFIDANNTIRNAAEIMKKNNTTAVLVRDTTSGTKSVIGILTTKDIVYRVLAKEYEPDFTVITRIMTPSPEFGDKEMGIVEAFEVMYEGHFLSLPVTDDSHSVIGIVSVLQLTNMALLQLKHGMTDEAELQEGFSDVENPQWDRFWGTRLDPDMMDRDNFEDLTYKSDYSLRSAAPPIRSPTKSSISIHNSSLKKKSKQSPRMPASRQLRLTENDDQLSLASELSQESVSYFLPPDSDAYSMVLGLSERKTEQNGVIRAQRKGYTFKIKDQNDNNRMHKVKVLLPKSKNLLSYLKQAIDQKLSVDPELVELSFLDEDDDMIIIQSEEDLKQAIEILNNNKYSNIALWLKRAGQDNSPPQGPPEMLKNETSKISDLLLRPEILISAGLFTMSVGILVGITLARSAK